jgi:hypothetical protein
MMHKPVWAGWLGELADGTALMTGFERGLVKA